jgi:hypothetical protein
MEKQSVKEALLSYMASDRGVSKLNEETGQTGPAGPAKDSSAKEVNDPDKNAENPDLTDLMGTHNSILFLSAPDKTGIIKRGGNLGFIELTPSIVAKSGLEVDLEDFQWYCPANEFEEYLKKTGRAYNKNTGEWTSESQEFEEETKIRKISTYSDFLNEKEELEPLNEFTGIPLLGNVGTNVTGKGMEWQGEDPNFQKGKLSDDQRRLIRFLFTRNHLRKSGKMEKELNLTKLKQGDEIEIFVTAFDAKSGKSDEQSMVGITFIVDAVILAQGDLEVPMVAGKITHLSPNLGSDEGGGFTGVLEAVVKSVYSVWDKLTGALETSTGKIFAGIAAIAGAYKVGIFTSIAVMKIVNSWRVGQIARDIMANAPNEYKGTKGAIMARKEAKAATLFGRLKTGIKNSPIGKFVGWPTSMVKNYRDYKKFKNLTWAQNLKRASNWKYARYIMFGEKIGKAAKVTGIVARGSRVLSGVAKWSNPVGWAFLAADAIGSFMNFTSDNQAPAWDPRLLVKIGGKGDAMKDYAYEGGPCPNAKNSFNPKDVKVGETITLCWTQNPTKGFALALSFVMSNSTRTTMNITKINDFKEGELSMFLINSVNYTDLWNKIKEYNIRFLFIKNGTYEEGYMDDNIGAYFLGAKSNPDSKDGVLPISYYGHCGFATFVAESNAMKDQLIAIDETAPQVFNFHFEDSESNIINVMGTKVKDKDLENASEEEINSFFTVAPVSSYIGNPDEETEEEKEERESIENSVKLNSVASDGTEEESPENTELAKNESTKWYSSIEESKPITSFGEFKMIKESLLLEKDPPVEGGTPKQGVEALPTEQGGDEEETKLEDIKGTSLGSQIITAKQLNANFEEILNNIEEPIPFSIYFVENREYADPELRNIYQPGSFMNFSLDSNALKAADGEDIEGHIQVNNLDILLDAKKGVYNFSERDRETKIKDSDLGSDDNNVKSSNTILTANTGSSRDKKFVSPSSSSSEIEKEEAKTTIERMNPDQLSKLDISNWDNVSSVKIIRDGDGNPETIKIKNKKAKFGDKSRKFEKGDPGFEEALALAKANSDKEKEEEEMELAKR